MPNELYFHVNGPLCAQRLADIGVVFLLAREDGRVHMAGINGVFALDLPQTAQGGNHLLAVAAGYLYLWAVWGC